ncbi:MAG TPA: DUF6510 family protein [Streptosporangiaceae bacterium]|nr:DUF6510 family protein [Streptosporangiaceae bacterium]
MTEKLYGPDDSALDGNAIGGLLHEVFRTEMTAAEATCAHCGNTAQVAEAVVYVRAPGTVMRCRTCTSVLAVVVRKQEMNCVDMSGVAALQAG